jgi:hypothetical protein
MAAKVQVLTASVVARCGDAADYYVLVTSHPRLHYKIKLLFVAAAAGHELFCCPNLLHSTNI